MNILTKTALIITTSIAMLGTAQAGPMIHAKKLCDDAFETLRDGATTDKGGHRVAAMKHLKAAMAEIEAGIAFDKANVTSGEKQKKKNK